MGSTHLSSTTQDVLAFPSTFSLLDRKGSRKSRFQASIIQSSEDTMTRGRGTEIQRQKGGASSLDVVGRRLRLGVAGLELGTLLDLGGVLQELRKKKVSVWEEGGREEGGRTWVTLPTRVSTVPLAFSAMVGLCWTEE